MTKLLISFPKETQLWKSLFLSAFILVCPSSGPKTSWASTTSYDGTYVGNESDVATCTVEGFTVTGAGSGQLTFTIANGVVTTSGFVGGVDSFGNLNMSVSNGGETVTWTGKISFTG